MARVTIPGPGINMALDVNGNAIIRVDPTIMDAVANAGFVNVNGPVVLDVGPGASRTFLHTMTGNIDLSFANIPNSNEFPTEWTQMLVMDGVGGYEITTEPAVTWLDGNSFDSLNYSPNAVNVIQYWHLGGVTFAALAWNGGVRLDPYKISFTTNDTVTILAEKEIIDVANTATFGTGSVTFTKNGVAITGATLAERTFTLNQRLGVVVTGVSGEFIVSIPRFLA